MEDLRLRRIEILLQSLVGSVPDPKLPSFYAHAKPGPEPTSWIDCRGGCEYGFVKDHGRVRVCSRCVGRGVELIDPYLAEWTTDSADDTVEFHSRLDDRRRLNREIARLEHLERVRAGQESTLDGLIAALGRSSAWDRHGSYPDLRRALERMTTCFPSIAHVVVWSEVYGIQKELSSTAQRYRELGLRLLSRWMPDEIRLPSWLEPPRQERLLYVEQMIADGWKASRIARSLKISEGKAKRLTRAARRGYARAA